MVAKRLTVESRETDSDQKFRESVKDLDGEIAGCWCRGLDENTPLCHGDAIRAVVEDLNSE